MTQKHPYADATYRILPHDDVTYAVEVNVPGNSPALVTSFATEAKASDWITAHRQQVENGLMYKSWRTRPAKAQPSTQASTAPSLDQAPE